MKGGKLMREHKRKSLEASVDNTWQEVGGKTKKKYDPETAVDVYGSVETFSRGEEVRYIKLETEANKG